MPDVFVGVTDYNDLDYYIFCYFSSAADFDFFNIAFDSHFCLIMFLKIIIFLCFLKELFGNSVYYRFEFIIINYYWKLLN